MEYSWANDFPEIQQICVLYSMTELMNVTRFRYKPIKSILQQGPTCGIVALTMCSENPSGNLVKQLLSIAQERGYSRNGEMFSAENMCQLAKTCLTNPIALYDGYLYTEKIINFLHSGGLMLVPYDSDNDHSPTCHHGRKAHWAAVCGILETNSEIYLVCRQGKSHRIFIWPLGAMAKSNSQLVEVCPIRENSEEGYIIPAEGIGGPSGLRNKAILIFPKTE